MTHVYISFYLLRLKFFHRLATVLKLDVFFLISKAFDKVWHKGLILKLKQNGLTDDLMNILIDFLKERKQRVVLNGQHSKCSNISAGGP